MSSVTPFTDNGKIMQYGILEIVADKFESQDTEPTKNRRPYAVCRNIDNEIAGCFVTINRSCRITERERLYQIHGEANKAEGSTA